MDNLPLPQDKNSEMGIISSLLQNPAKASAACDSKNLQEDWLNDADHQKAYRFIRQMIKEGRPVDLITVSGYFSDRYKEIGLATPNIHGFITELFCFVPTWSNIGYYITCVQEMAAKRFALIAAMEVQKKLREPLSLQETFEIVGSCFTKTQETCVITDDDTDYDQKAMMAFLDEKENQAMGRSKPEFFQTGLPTIDNEVGGMVRGELVLITGRRGTGKSLLGMKFLANSAFSAKKSRVACYSFEMPYGQVVERLVASHGSVSLKAQRDGIYTKQELDSFQRSMAIIMESNIKIYDMHRLKQRTPGAIFASIRKHAKNHGADMIMVDHLGLIKFKDGGKGVARVDEQMHDFSAEFKAACLELNMVGLLLAQENTEGGTFGSTQVETDPDSILSLTPTWKIINGTKRIVGTDGCFIPKWRCGDLLGRKIPLRMEGKYARLHECQEEQASAAF